jgi:signal transduction histidine kinase
MSYRGIGKRIIGKPYRYVAVGAVAAVVSAAVCLVNQESAVKRTLRIGFQNAVPYHFPDSTGRASGPAVEIVRAAAERRNIRLEWVFSPQGPERALASGVVDLWPIVVDRPERHALLYISPPWNRVSYALVVPQREPEIVGANLNGKTLAAVGSDARIAREYFPGATIVPAQGLASVGAAVCTGAADAGLVSINAFVDAHMSDCDNGALRIQPVEGAPSWFGVGANKDRRDAIAAANSLRDEIGEMALDGRLAAIDFHWNTKVGQEVSTIFAYHRARVYTAVSLVAVGVLLAMLGVMVWLTTRLRTTQQRVAQRTTELESANKELEAFAYSISHDLRAPLRAIDGFSGALFSQYHESIDTQGKHYLDRIQAGARRMGQLIDDLLNLSRITRGTFDQQPVHLSELAEDIVADLRADHPRRQVECLIGPGLTTTGDPGLLRVALQNLLSNAWKFTATRQVARIEFGLDNRDGERAYFVRDNGVGFDMNYAELIFTPFHRLHGEREFPGTGIGLALVQRVVNRHGGRIWAEAAVKEGATLFFTLREAA